MRPPATRRHRMYSWLLMRRPGKHGPAKCRQNKLLTGEVDRICSGKAPDELVRLTGSLELISHDTKAELIRRFLDIAVTLARAKRHCAPYLAALGLLLNRTPLYAGPETVVSPDLVERTYSAFQDFDWTNPELLDLQNLFLRAARVVDDRRLMPIGRSDVTSMYDESLPPGLLLGSNYDNAGG